MGQTSFLRGTSWQLSPRPRAASPLRLSRREFDVVIELDSEGYYVASAPQLPACHTQAHSLDVVTARIREAIALCLETKGAPEQELEFIGIQRMTIAD
jgi:predicted RNase H-like HicB family nuclease